MNPPGEFGIQITDQEFNLLRKLIYDQFGIELTEKKRNLIPTRLQKVLVQKGFKTFKEYHEFLVNDRTREGLIEMINHISTNHTYFYREKAHFDYFQQTALPAIMNNLKTANSRDIRIWSAGCSSGEEPYMLVILMLELLGDEYWLWDAGVLATDISKRVLEFALNGVYPTERMLYLPKHLQTKYFKKAGEGWVISEKIRKEVLFRRFNLMGDFPFKKPFQVIFCRNVMIYFDEPTRNRLVDRFARALEPGGFLFIGHSETIRNAPQFDYIMPALYQKKSTV